MMEIIRSHFKIITRLQSQDHAHADMSTQKANVKERDK